MCDSERRLTQRCGTAKKKRKSKKKANGQPQPGAKAAEVNGVSKEQAAEADEEDDDDEAPYSPIVSLEPGAEVVTWLTRY